MPSISSSSFYHWADVMDEDSCCQTDYRSPRLKAGTDSSLMSFIKHAQDGFQSPSPLALSRRHPSGNGHWPYVTTFAQSAFQWVKCRQVDLHRLQAEASEWRQQQIASAARMRQVKHDRNHLVVPWWDGSQVKVWSEGPRWEGSGHLLRAISYRPLHDTSSPCTQRLHLFISWE